jgi:hypothetical protein
MVLSESVQIIEQTWLITLCFYPVGQVELAIAAFRGND